MKYGRELVLDAMTETYDPDIGDKNQDKSEFQFTWLCRRECETLPKYNEDTWQELESGTACEFPTIYTSLEADLVDVGCFWHDGYNSSGNPDTANQ